MFGYMNKIIKIDLSTGRIITDTFDDDFARKFLGGNGFAVKLISESVPGDALPLSPDNVVVFATGPLTGTPVWGTGRGHMASISPLTRLFFDSNFGGNFPWMLKKAGVDAVVISGKSEKPVYILINDGEVSIKPAKGLWGKSTSDTHRSLLEMEGKGIESAIIGPAGENGVLYAGVILSGTRKSAAGRGGIGAVLGSKKCKALVVKGTKKVYVAHPDNLKDFLKTRLPLIREKARPLTDLGTPFLVNVINKKGMLGTRNNSRETFEHATNISGELIKEKYKKKNTACHGCPVACGKIVKVPSGDFVGKDVKMPEYETIYALGSMLENDDIVSIINSNTLLDEMGMDTISFGVSLAFFAECIEKGFVKEKDIDMPILFGDGEHLTEIIRKTAERSGIGEFLSLGSEMMAENIGHDSYKLLHSVKGLEIAGHSPRGLRMMGLSYATSTRGGSHHDARGIYRDPEVDPGFDDQADYCVRSQHMTAIGDSLVMCRFLSERAFGMVLDESILPLIKYVTGWDCSLNELETTGERIYNLERMINVQRGVERKMDRLPYRVMNEPIPDGPVKGRHVPVSEMNTMLDNYYELRGWDKNGIPTEKKLIDLTISV